MTLIFLVYFSSNRISSHETTIDYLEKTVSDLQNQSNIVFIWPNPWNSALYYIGISCTYGIPYGFEHLPEDKAVEILLREDCKDNRIPPDTMKILTSKKFSYVYWDMYFQGVENVIYKLTESEAESIAKAPWEYVAIAGFDVTIWKILRNTKNTARKWYEPTGNPEIYTQEDKEKCDPLWWDGLKEWHEEEWKIQAEKVLECYSNLPSIP
jgi:hypothetical protein